MSQPLGASDVLKGLCAVAAAMVGGALMFFGPAEIREELPDVWRITLGIGFFAFGGLFGVTILFASRSDSGSQAVASRFKGLLLAAVCGVVMVTIVMTTGRVVYAAWRLQGEGASVDAVVAQVKMKVYNSKVTFVYEVEYDDHRATIKAPGRLKRGDRVPVVYLPGEPDCVLHGHRDDGFAKLIDRSMGMGWAIGFGLVALVCAVVSLGGLSQFIFGVKPEPAATEI